MKSITKLITPVSVFVAIFGLSAMLEAGSPPAAPTGLVVTATIPQTLKVERSSDFGRVERLMNESKAVEVVVRIARGEYVLSDSFHINRSNVTLIGEEGVLLRLKDGVQAPVIAVGSQSSYPLEGERISGIRIVDIEIDGNRENQESEYNQELPWIRNNGIDVRLVSGLQVERVISNSNRSGGLVISWRCRDVVVRDCVFEDNYFDGVAYYDSREVFTVDCVMRGNRGAGVSLDNAFVDSMFIRCRIEGNRDVGVFARHSERLVFYDCAVADSGNWAFFLAHDEKEHGVFDVDIASCQIERNNGGVRMGSVTEAQSARNSVTVSTFADNDGRGREDLSTAGSRLHVFEEAWTSDAVANEGVNEKEVVSPYSSRVSQVLRAVGEIDA